MFVYTGRVHGRVHGASCTWQVGLPSHVHVSRRHATAVCDPSRPCTRPVHSPFTAVYTAVYDRRYTAVRHVHTSTPQLKGCVRAMYTSVYMASTQSCTWQVGLHSRVHGPRRHVTAVGAMYMVVYTSHTQPCTCSSTRPCTRPCTRPRPRTVCRNGPHTAVTCRLGTCTWPDRPTCRIHGLDGPCTRPCNGRVHGPLRGRVRAM